MCVGGAHGAHGRLGLVSDVRRWCACAHGCRRSIVATVVHDRHRIEDLEELPHLRGLKEELIDEADRLLQATLVARLLPQRGQQGGQQVGGETVTGGPYTISATLAPTGVLANYNVTYNTAAFSITARPASVTPNAASKVYGEVDPALTGVLNGFVV